MERLGVVEFDRTDEKQIVQAMDMSIKYPATALRQECMVRALESLGLACNGQLPAWLRPLQTLES
jgi:hypothetical protein